jgi:hypothetical protein
VAPIVARFEQNRTDRQTASSGASADPALFAPAEAAARAMIDDLVWWARTLRRGRDEAAR